MTQNAFFTRLQNRGLIHVEGPDRVSFLQNLITNDMAFLDDQPALYACLLSPQGKFLHDFFVTQTADAVLLECEGVERTQDLLKRLNMYRLRADVQLSAEDNVPVYGIIAEDYNGDGAYKDPRHSDIGWRSFIKPEGLEEKDFAAWDAHRINLTVPDGSRDLIPEKSTMDEGRIDQLNGVSYDKGCYVGQELTARMHYRGLGKKHLETVNINDLPQKAELRSTCDDIGIALVRN